MDRIFAGTSRYGFSAVQAYPWKTALGSLCCGCARPPNGGCRSTEYSDLILSIKIVTEAEEAITHFHRYGSGHTETIVTEDGEVAKKFVDEVDAAGVYHNA